MMAEERRHGVLNREGTYRPIRCAMINNLSKFALSERDPWRSAFEIFSLMAYPDNKKRRAELAGAFDIALRLDGVDKSIRDKFLSDPYRNALKNGLNKLQERLSHARITFFQIYNLRRDGYEVGAGFLPNISNHEQFEREWLGWDSTSESSQATYKSKIIATGRPFLHIAVILLATLLHNEHNGSEEEFLIRVIYYLALNPSDLLQFLAAAQTVSEALPSVHPMYRENQFHNIEITVPTPNPMPDNGMFWAEYRPAPPIFEPADSPGDYETKTLKWKPAGDLQSFFVLHRATLARRAP